MYLPNKYYTSVVHGPAASLLYKSVLIDIENMGNKRYKRFHIYILHLFVRLFVLTLSSTHLSICRFSLNWHRIPDCVIQNVLFSCLPDPMATSQKKLSLWLPSNPFLPFKGTVSFTCRWKDANKLTMQITNLSVTYQKLKLQ